MSCGFPSAPFDAHNALMRQTLVLLLTSFQVPSRKIAKRFFCCSEPVNVGWLPPVSDGRLMTTTDAMTNPMVTKRPRYKTNFSMTLKTAFMFDPDYVCCIRLS